MISFAPETLGVTTHLSVRHLESFLSMAAAGSSFQREGQPGAQGQQQNCAQGRLEPLTPQCFSAMTRSTGPSWEPPTWLLEDLKNLQQSMTSTILGLCQMLLRILTAGSSIPVPVTD